MMGKVIGCFDVMLGRYNFCDLQRRINELICGEEY